MKRGASDIGAGLADYGSPYSHFANAYAAGEERAFSERMAELALGLAGRHRTSPIRSVADLACGIGAASVVFARRGLDVVGVDISQDMIRHAKELALGAGVAVRFEVQDYRELSLAVPVDLVTCMYDSLNFMQTEADLIRAFTSVRASLLRQGVFVFDMYTLRGLSEYWGSRAEIHTDTARHFVATQTLWNYETASNTKVLHGFTLGDDGHWSRWAERHTISAYSLDRVCQALVDAGLVVREVVDPGDGECRSVNDHSHRAVFVAQVVR